MQIGIDISRIAVAGRTGTEQYTYELLAAIARCDRRTRFTLYSNRLPEELPPLGTNFSLRSIPLRRLWTHARLSAAMFTERPDVLFIPAHVVPLGAPLSRVPTVVTVHDLGYLHVPEAHTSAQRLMLRLTTAWSARVAVHVIAISCATRDDLVRLARIPAQKISVIYHGVSPRFRPMAGAQRVGMPPYFLYVGTVQPRKNLVRLIESFARFARSDPGSTELVIAGKRGWLTEAIEHRAGEVGVAHRVRFTGYVTDAELRELYAGALAFVFPSLYEGFGMPVLEAMAAGAPVLTSNSSALPEVAGNAALFVDPLDTAAIADGLARLAGDAALRETLRARGLARIDQFSWERCADETLAVLRNAV